jgi:hypothetical protein
VALIALIDAELIGSCLTASAAVSTQRSGQAESFTCVCKPVAHDAGFDDLARKVEQVDDDDAEQ